MCMYTAVYPSACVCVVTAAFCLCLVVLSALWIHIPLHSLPSVTNWRPARLKPPWMAVGRRAACLSVAPTRTGRSSRGALQATVARPALQEARRQWRNAGRNARRGSSLQAQPTWDNLSLGECVRADELGAHKGPCLCPQPLSRLSREGSALRALALSATQALCSGSMSCGRHGTPACVPLSPSTSCKAAVAILFTDEETKARAPTMARSRTGAVAAELGLGGGVARWVGAGSRIWQGGSKGQRWVQDGLPGWASVQAGQHRPRLAS